MDYFPSRFRRLLVGVAAGAALAASLHAQGSAPAGAIGKLKLMSIEELLDLEVTSVSRRAERLSETASAIQVITADDIRQSGAASIPEALRIATNLQVARKGSHSWGISARGFNTDLANKLLVLVDGRTVYTPLYSGVFWDRQDYLLDDIDRIEVISGPGGSIWGANAVNGVINVTTKSAKNTQGLYLDAGTGSSLTYSASARYGGTISADTHYRIYGKIFERESEVLATGRDAGDEWNMRQGGFRIDSTPTSENEFTLQGDVYRENARVPSGALGISSGGNLLGRWTRQLQADASFKLQVYYDRTHLISPAPAQILGSTTFAPAGSLRDDLDTFDLDFQHDFSAGKIHRIVWGTGYRYQSDRVVNAPSVGFFPTRLNQALFSAFAQDRIALRENLHLTIGTKVEHTDYTGWEFEPGIRLQLDTKASGMFWAAASRAVRAPSRIDRDLLQAPPPGFGILKGGAAFDSETVIAYELGWRGQLTAKSTVSLATFYNNYDKIRSTSLSPVTVFPLFFANNLEAETYGAELAATYQVTDAWQFSGGYTLLKEDVRIKSGRSDLNAARNETADPEQQFSIRSSYRVGQLELSSSVRWVGDLATHSGPTPGITPDYSSVDVRLGWNPTEHLEFSIVGQDILEAHHPEYGYPDASREEIRRSIFGKVVLRY